MTAEPVYFWEDAANVAEELMQKPPEVGILRAFTLRLNGKLNKETLWEFRNLAHENRYNLHLGEDVYIGTSGKQEYQYSVIWFFNQQPCV